MITCKLNEGMPNEKSYHVPFVTGRALREIDPAWKTYLKLSQMAEAAASGEQVTEEDAAATLQKQLDVLVEWFCTLFQDQFTPDEFYDGYPSDRVVHDIVMALLAVQSNTTKVLKDFPTQPTAAETATMAG